MRCWCNLQAEMRRPAPGTRLRLLPVTIGGDSQETTQGSPNDQDEGSPEHGEPTKMNRGGKRQDSSDPSTQRHSADHDVDVDEERLAQVLDQYFDALQAGDRPDREALFAAHPDLADELQSCLAGIDFVQGNSPADIPTQLGDFKIVREIGRGGMGIVYEAEQISLSRRVALKVQRYPISDPETLERFQREAETAANLHHTNIVPIHAIGRHDDVHFFAMQLVEGKSLAAVIEEAAYPIDWRDAAEWGLQACDALIHAHQRQVIHRDVKPSNLILDADGRIWLTDFGLAKRQGDAALSITGVILGTPRYMSPEQAQSVRCPLDHRTDIYSLGATLYEVVSGKPLFEANSPHGMLAKIINEVPVPLRQVRRDIPTDLDTIISKCLRKSAEERYDSARDMAADMRAVLEGRGIRARRPSLWSRAKRTWKRHHTQITTAAIGALIAILCIGTAVGWSRWYRTSRLGKLRLTTDSARRLTAEVLDDEGRAVVAPFALPLQEPISVPDGNYRLRVSAPGEMGDTFWISIERGKTTELPISLEPRRTHELSYQGATEFVERGGKYDLLEFSGPHIILRDGTGDARWSIDGQALSREPELQKVDPNFHFGWASDSKITGRGQLQRHPHVVSPAPDLNADGTPDIVLALRHRATLIALNGKDGRFLWAATGIEQQIGGAITEYGTLWGDPLVRDVDGDGTQDLIGLFAHTTWQRDDMIRLLGTRWIQAVSGLTGKTLWTRELPDSWFNDWYGSVTEMAPPAIARWRANGQCQESLHSDRMGSTVRTLDNGLFVPFPLQTVEIEGHTYGMVVACNTLCLFDLAKGHDYVTPRKLGYCPVRPPQVLHFRDGSDVVLLCRQKRMALRGPATGELTLDLRQLLDGQSIWTKEINADWQWQFDYSLPSIDWPKIVDLERDGIPEIVVPNARDVPDKGRYSEHLSVVDARSGQDRWSSAAALYTTNRQLDHFVEGADLNEDGYRELYVVSQHVAKRSEITTTGQPRTNRLFLDVLSGATGETLAVRSLPLFVDVGSDGHRISNVFWWNQGNCGRLVVSLQGTMDSDVESVCCFLDPAKLEFSQTVARAELPQLADVNGDSVPELITRDPRQRQHLDAGGSLQVWGTHPSGIWKGVGQRSRLVGDVDGDQVSDIAAHTTGESNRLAVYSGRDGRRIWHRTTGLNNARIVPLGRDLDRDGRSDFVISRHGWQANNDAPVVAISGRDGKEIWKLQFDQLVTQWFAPHVTLQTQLNPATDEESKPAPSDLLWLVQGEMGQPTAQRPNPDRVPSWLLRIDSELGVARWKKQLTATSRFPKHQLVTHSSPVGESRTPTFCQFLDTINDLDGDGVLDLLTIGTDQGDLSLLAVSGDMGDTLWRFDLSGAHDFTRPVVTDLNGDRNFEVCWLTFEYQGRSLVATVHCLDASSGGIPSFFDSDDRGNAQLFRTRAHSSLESIHGRGPGLSWGFPELIPVAFGNEIGVGFWIRNPGNQFEFITLHCNANHEERLIVADSTLLVSSADVQTNEANFEFFRVWCSDVDKDQHDELITVTHDHIVALELESGEVIWKHPLSDEQRALVLGIQPTSDRASLAIQLLRHGNNRSAIEILAAGTGQRVATAGRIQGGLSDVLDRLELDEISTDEMRGVINGPHGTSLLVSSAAPERSSSGYPDGLTVREPAAPPRKRRDIRYARGLPWSHMANGGFVQTLLWPTLVSILLGTGLVYLPARFLGSLIVTRRMTVAQLALAPCLVGLAIVLLQMPLPSIPELAVTADRSTNRIVARLLAAFLSGLPLTYIILVSGRLVLRQQWYRLLIGVGFVFVCAGLIAMAVVVPAWNRLRLGEYLVFDGWWSLLLIAAQTLAFLMILRRLGGMLLHTVYRPAKTISPAFSDTQSI